MQVFLPSVVVAAAAAAAFEVDVGAATSAAAVEAVVVIDDVAVDRVEEALEEQMGLQKHLMNLDHPLHK
jgi:hypothetical protein